MGGGSPGCAPSSGLLFRPVVAPGWPETGESPSGGAGTSGILLAKGAADEICPWPPRNCRGPFHVQPSGGPSRHPALWTRTLRLGGGSEWLCHVTCSMWSHLLLGLSVHLPRAGLLGPGCLVRPSTRFGPVAPEAWLAAWARSDCRSPTVVQRGAFQLLLPQRRLGPKGKLLPFSWAGLGPQRGWRKKTLQGCRPGSSLVTCPRHDRLAGPPWGTGQRWRPWSFPGGAGRAAPW